MSGKDILLSVDHLVSCGLSDIYVRRVLSDCRTGRIKSYAHIPDPQDARRKLIYYHSLPERVKEMVKTKLCDGLEPTDYLKYQAASSEPDPVTELSFEIEQAMQNEFGRFVSLYNDLPAVKAAELAKQACVLNIGMQIADRSYTAKYTLQHFLQAVNTLGIPGLKLTNYSYLARKIREAKEKGLGQVIKVPRAGNQNRQVLSPFHKHIILGYYASPKNLTVSQVYELVSFKCAEYGEVVPAEGTVKNFVARKQTQLLVAPYRRGEKFDRDNILPHIKRSCAFYPGDLWNMDGTRLNMLAKKQVMRNGKPTWVLTNYDVFLVTDDHTGAILGFDLAPNEDRWMVRKALRMAVAMTGHLPAELLSDNSSAIKADETKHLIGQMELMGMKYRNARVGNARDKTVERLIATLQTTTMSWFDTYQGAGITAQKRSSNRPAPEWTASQMENALSIEELVCQFADAVAIYNSQKVLSGLSRMDAYRKMDRPNAYECPAVRQIGLFWSSKVIKMRQGHITMTIRHEEHFFRVSSPDVWMDHEGTQVEVKYDERDLSSVYLFKADGTFISEVKKAKQPPRAEANQTDEDKLNYYKEAARIKRMAREREQRLEDLKLQAMEQTGGEEIDLSVNVYALKKEDLNNAESLALINYVKDQWDISGSRVKIEDRLNDLYGDGEAADIRPYVPKQMDDLDDEL